MHCRDYDNLSLNINKKLLQPFQVTQLGNKQCVLTHSYNWTGKRRKTINVTLSLLLEVKISPSHFRTFHTSVNRTGKRKIYINII